MKLELAEEPLEKKGLRGRPEEAQAQRGRVSPAAGKRYPLTLICAVWRVARSSVYASAVRASLAGNRDGEAPAAAPCQWRNEMSRFWRTKCPTGARVTSRLRLDLLCS
jgi:hypothetical protein